MPQITDRHSYSSNMELLCKRLRKFGVLYLTLLLSATAIASPIYHVKVVHTYPHLTTSYTEGFFFRDGLFYEGTGLKSHSQILVYKPSGEIVRHYDVAPEFFGEGIVDWGDNLLEWTWQSHTGTVFD